MNNLVSVIVPVYNVENFLPVCIDSILGQSFTCLEVILVDDGSTDNSGIICDNYVKFDNRIKVIHINNSGPSVARNKGLEQASGEYISFVDSDDRMHPKMLEDMILSLKEHPECQLSICQFKFEESYSPFNDVAYRVDKIVDGESLIDAMFTLENTNDNPQRSTITSLINKLYRRDAIEDISFSGRRWFEDYEYNIQVYNRISKAVILQGKYFYHLVRDGSLAHLPQSSQGTDGIEGLKFCYSLIPRKLKEARYKWITNFYYKLLYTYEETHNSYIEVYNKSTIKKEIKPYLVDFIIYSNKSTIWFTIKTILYVLFPDLFILLINRKK